MSIKNLFDRNSSKTLPSSSLQQLGYKVESERNLKAKLIDQQRVVPHVDFSDPVNFARYGSAQKYYTDAIQRIYKEFPYDGSEAEMQEFYNQGNHVDRYIFDKRYPRTTGYAVFSAGGWGDQADESAGYGAPSTASYEYIKIVGGPNSGSEEFLSRPIHEAFSGSNIYDENIYDTENVHADGRYGTRESNLKTDLNRGVTVEFWLKKSGSLAAISADGAAHSAPTEKEVIFDLWNGITLEAANNSDDNDNDKYGRLRIELDGDVTGSSPFKVTMLSGSSHGDPNGFSNLEIGKFKPSDDNIAPYNGKWNHYAFVIQNSGSTASDGVTLKFYFNGELNETKTQGNTCGEITGSLIANIGALRTAPSGTFGPSLGWGKLSGSIDEFRFWKVARTSEEIGNNWWHQVRGGTNTDLANTTLGVYYKFNEGITGTSSVDSVVLDYGGRIANGKWVGYSSTSRSTGSAFNSYSGSALTEYKDPIVYSFHSDVDSLNTKLKDLGTTHDQQNNASLLNSLPGWIREESEEMGAGALKSLTQIIGSYFDDLQMQIELLPKLKNINYLSSSEKPFPFSAHLLEHMGLEAPELFVDSDIVASIMNRTETEEYELELHNVKNMIYHNIYNNLTHIYKSKGTEKSYRNLFHCFGIGDNILNINLYGNNETYLLEDNFKNTVVRKKYVDFNDADRFSATVYQDLDSNNSNASGSFITGSGIDDDGGDDLDSSIESYMGMTVECEVILPKKLKRSDNGFFETPFITSSLFGMHTANPTDHTDMTWYTDSGLADPANFFVYAIRDELESDHVSFYLSSSIAGIPKLTSSFYLDAYDNQKWNFAVRIKPENYPIVDSVTGSSPSLQGDYSIEFYGNHSTLDYIEDEFNHKEFIDPTTAMNLLRSSKRLYVGAHRDNFNGDVIEKSDAKISSLRYWTTYLPQKVLRMHARDPESVGIDNPYRNAIFMQGTSSFSGSGVGGQFIEMPRFDTLALHWDFATVTGSDDSGEFVVDDVSSGSSGLTSRYGFMGNLRYNQHTGKGYGFPAGSTAVVDKRYVQSAKSTPPEILNSYGLVKILSQDDDVFVRNQSPVNYFVTLEKSMYRAVTDEMLSMFSSIADFADLIAEPGSLYRDEYKRMRMLRQLFFERVRNTPDLDKYVEYYKWLDSSMSTMIEQLTPASLDMPDEVRTVIESHMLERSKYRVKLPMLKNVSATEGSLRGVNELGYSWKYGHAPVSGFERENALWWKERAERTQDQLSTDGGADSPSLVDAERESLKDRIVFNNSEIPPTLAKSDRTAYQGSAYAIRRLNKPYRLKVEESKTISSGINYHPAKKRDFVHSAVFPHGPVTSLGVPENVLIAFADKMQDFQEIDDEPKPPELVKRRYPVQVRSGRFWETNTYIDNSEGDMVLPFNVYSASVNTGYNQHVVKGFASGALITNIHTDTYGQNRGRPLQGPFTEKYVGGHQSRHVDLNKYDTSLVTRQGDHGIHEHVPGPHGSTKNNLDDSHTRPEAWRLLLYKIKQKIGGEDCYENVGAFGLVGPDYGGPYPDRDRLRATMFREPMAKRPVNIRNIQQKTGSTIIGNYTENHNIIQSAGRTINNLYFKENSGITLPDLYNSSSNLTKTTNVHSWWSTRALAQNKVGNSFLSDPGLQGLSVGEATLHGLRSPEYNTSLRFAPQGDSSATVYTLEQRGEDLGSDKARNKTVIASRFSAPGGPETLSRGFLDIAAEEHSPYNSLNYRNWAVRGSGSGESSTMRMNNHLSGPVGDNVSARAERDGLRSLLTRHCGQFGHDNVYGSVLADTYVQVPSFHKVNRNMLQRLKLNVGETLDASENIATTSSVFDNYWVQHPIPRNEFQYSWITASLKRDGASQPIVGGYTPANGEIRTFNDDGTITYSAAIEFLAESEEASVDDVWGSPQGETQNDATAVRTNFVGINTNIVEPLTSSTNTLGHPLTVNLGAYLNIGNVDKPTVAANTAYDGGFLSKYTDASDEANVLNSLILHRQGPYGWPTWKQIRGDQHKISRHQRKNNILTVAPDKQVVLQDPSDAHTVSHLTKGSIESYDTSPVTTRYNPIKISLGVSTGTEASIGAGRAATIKTITMQASHGNNLAGFDNQVLNDNYGPTGDMEQAYDKLKSQYLQGETENILTSVSTFSFLRYKETVYPAAINMYRNHIRERQSYQNTFWRGTRIDRDSLGLNIPNSMGLAVTQSCWPLDGPDDLFGADSIGAQVFPTISGSDATSPGELLNVYSQLHHEVGPNRRSNTILPGALYARYQTLPIEKAVSSPSSRASAPTSSTDDVRIKPGNFLGDFHSEEIRRIQVPIGMTKWEAPRLAGYISSSLTSKGGVGEDLSKKGRPASVREASFISDPGQPWYENYSEYVSDLRAKFKDYSIIPEFRISEHMDFYIKESQGDFRTENLEILSIEGSPNRDNDYPQNSSQSDFYKIYSNSDFMKYFDVIKQDHEADSFAFASVIALRCKAAIKFVPYDGFYPAQRTLDLASQFSASYFDNVAITGDDTAVDRSGPRPIMQAFFAPGIMYNTIKSGMAIDYPVMLTPGRLKRHQINSGGTVDPTYASDYWGFTMARGGVFAGSGGKTAESGVDTEKKASEWDYRIPFEALVEPEKYVKNISFFDMEPHPSASFDVTASWDGSGDKRYKLMASNFLAETADFFLPNGQFTKIISTPESKLNLSLIEGDIYGARIKLRRSMNHARTWKDEYFIGKTAGTSSELMGLPYELPQDPKNQSALKETFTMYSRTTAFGPPMLGRHHTADRVPSSAERAEVSGALDSLNGYNWSFTPPYYHGEAWADLVFKADSTKTYTMTEIINGTTVKYWRADPGQVKGPYEWENADPYGDGQDASYYEYETTFIPYGDNKNSLYSGRNINQNAMQLSASVNLFGSQKVLATDKIVAGGGSPTVQEVQQTLSDAWVLQPKFETPMVNFSQVGIRPITVSDGTLSAPSTKLSGAVSVGMWHQFGNIPETEDKGIFLEIGDIPNNWLTYHHSASVANGHYAPGLNAEDAYYIQYKMKSLTDLVGFSTEPTRLGSIASKKTVKEAIVAIPFVQEGGERKFFEIPREYIDAAQVGGVLAGQSIQDMVEKMNNYVFPPNMNFLLYDDITPFAMYIFEFEYEFDKDDLNYIWQNLAPRSHKKFSTAEATISHQLFANELMGYANQLSNVTMKDKLQWMVFKVKQKAKTNYFDKVVMTNPEQEGLIRSPNRSESRANLTTKEFDPDYSYNWPYDYFSFVEMIKLEAEVEIS